MSLHEVWAFKVAAAWCIAASVLTCNAWADTAPVFPVSAVIAQVKRELAAAQNAQGAGLKLVLDKVEATLLVSRVVDANGKVSIGVPTVGFEASGSGSRKAEESSTLYVELVPPKPTAFLGATDSKDFGLTEAIVETRRELLKGLADEPRLDPRKVVITVKFGITRNLGASGQLKLVVISVGAGASVTTLDVNTIVLSFSKAP